MYISDILTPAFIVATVVAMLLITRGRWERDSRFLAVAWIFLGVLVVTGILVIQAFSLQVQQEAEKHIARFTKLAASVIGSMGHSDVSHKAAMDAPQVQSLLRMVEIEQRTFPTVAAFYTVRMLPTGQFVFIISPENDYNRNGVYGEASAKEEAVPPGTSYPMSEEAERFVLSGLRGETLFTQKVFTDSWGKWTTVVAPIRSEHDRRIEAVLVGDIPASEWNKFLANSAFWPPWGAFFVWSLYVIAVGITLRQQEAIVNLRSHHRQLQEEIAQLRENTQNKSLARISHEVRTPLTAILGYAEILAEKRFVPSGVSACDIAMQRHEAISVIHNNTGHIVDLIDDTFCGSSQRETPNIRPFPLAPLLQEVVTLYKPLAIQKRLALEITDETPFPEQIVTDRTRLKQVLLNLVSNAIKFTFHGKVSIIVASTAGNLQITVCDTGIGMSPETLASLFTPYHRAADVSQRGIDGTGLGLAISHEIIQQLGGDIRVTSEPQVGASFVVQLPHSPAVL